MALRTSRVEPWVFAELEDLLPDGGNRYEVVDGNLVVSPPPSQAHQVVSARLAQALNDASPGGWIAVQELPLPLGTDGRIPDVSVVSTAAPLLDRSRRLPVGPEWFGLVVEVVSPRTAKTDRFLKPAEYAAAGIPCFWRVELDPTPTVVGFRLDGDRYVETSPLPVPWGVLDLDVAELLALP